MAEDSKIEWTDHTFNPWMGCTKVHEGCKHCYAETLMDSRYGKVQWGPNGTRTLTSDANWKKPLKWNRDAEKAGVRAKVFCASLADVFEDWEGGMTGGGGLPVLTDGEHFVATNGPECDAWRTATMSDVRNRLFALIDATPHLDWLLLTKRPENIRRMGFGEVPRCFSCGGENPNLKSPGAANWQCACGEVCNRWFRHNVWLGTSISTQEHADNQVPELLKCSDLAANLFLSVEPMLGPIDLYQYLYATAPNTAGPWRYPSGRIVRSGGIGGHMMCSRPANEINWIICGGESGANARPMHPDWVRSLRDQCKEAGVPFFFKQWGEWSHEIVEGVSPALDELKPNQCVAANDHATHVRFTQVGKKAAGRLLDGVEWNQFPPQSPSLVTT